MSPPERPLVSPAQIRAARDRIAAHIQATPAAYDAQLKIWLKWENQQVTGSFKPRGALNKVLGLAPAERAQGLVACSAGNHGLGVALAAQISGARATVYCAAHAARNKIEKMQALGAEVVTVAGGYGQAELAAIEAARAQGKTFVSPYNDLAVIAGQGTLALELRAQCPEADRWLAPVGGGGLIAGLMAGAGEGVAVYGVQAEASPMLHHQYHFHDMSRAVDLPSLADGLSGTIEPGSVTLEAIDAAKDMLLVTESQIAEAIAYAYRAHGQVVEGSGAVGLAAVLNGQLQGDGRTVVVVTGGNIDLDRHRALTGR